MIRRKGLLDKNDGVLKVVHRQITKNKGVVKKDD